MSNHATTYCDGDQPGCVWSGTPHASTSSRSAQSRAGGRVYDLWDDYGVAVVGFQGIGMPGLTLNTLDQGLLPGTLFQSTKVQPREFALICEFGTVSLTSYHASRDELLDALKPDLVYPDQPVRLRYTGGARTVEIAAYYQGGLEGDIEGGQVERTALRFLATDPFFYELGQQATALSVGTSVANADNVIARIDGVWQGLAALSAYVSALAIGFDQTLYAGGLFVNASGDANADYIAKWTGSAWAALSTGCNGSVEALLVAPNGYLYLGGTFTLAGGIADTARIARWSATFAPLSTGLNGNCYALAWGIDNRLYAGGSFTQAAAVADTVRIAAWDGTNWIALATGIDDGTVFCIASDSRSTPAAPVLYIGGSFTTVGGASKAYLVKWDGSAFSLLGTAPNGAVHGLAIGPDGYLYAGGEFTTIGGVSASRIARWNGQAWFPLGSGVNGQVNTLHFEASGKLHVTGAFTQAGGLYTVDGYALWNGHTWEPAPISLPGTPTVGAIVEQQGRLYLGYNTTGTAVVPSANTVSNAGTRTVYPKVVVSRSGGTSAKLVSIHNQTTGQQLLLNYDLADGEKLTIDLTLGERAITSDYFGDVLGRASLPGSDFASFGLLPGTNSLTVYMDNVGTPTITAYVLAPVAHWSPEGPS